MSRRPGQNHFPGPKLASRGRRSVSESTYAPRIHRWRAIRHASPNVLRRSARHFLSVDRRGEALLADAIRIRLVRAACDQHTADGMKKIFGLDPIGDALLLLGLEY